LLSIGLRIAANASRATLRRVSDQPRRLEQP
jgi:hypothetical protein